MSLHPMSDRVGLRAPVAFAAVALLLFGAAYSVAGTALGAALFPREARGSLMERNGRIVGSALVAQPVSDARYVHARPSAAGNDPMAAAGSNQARSNPDLRARMDAARREVARRERIPAADVPGELITQSGSGLDPHLSPAAARVQVARVARARGLAEADVLEALRANTEPATLGVLGEPRVNVLRLNLALDAKTHASLR